MAATAGVQLIDPVSNPEPAQVSFGEDPAVYTNVALERLDMVDHRTRYYRDSRQSNSSSRANASELPRQAPENLLIVKWFDVSDGEYRIKSPTSDPPAVRYKSVDGVWMRQDDSSWTYYTWPETTGLFVNQVGSFVGPPNRTSPGSSITVLRNTSEVIVVKIDGPVIAGTSQNSSSRVTIEKTTGRVTDVRQITRGEGIVYYNRLVIDHYETTDVSRPADAPYPFKALLYDLKRGPIPLHEVF